jgi:hypothetical protein
LKNFNGVYQQLNKILKNGLKNFNPPAKVGLKKFFLSQRGQH